MENYKYFVDALSSTVALIAIITVLWSWFKNSQKPESSKHFNCRSVTGGEVINITHDDNEAIEKIECIIEVIFITIANHF